MRVEDYQQMLNDGTLCPGILLLDDEMSVENCMTALKGIYHVKRFSQDQINECPEYFKDHVSKCRIVLEISKLEKDSSFEKRERILGIQEEIKETCGEYIQ